MTSDNPEPGSQGPKTTLIKRLKKTFFKRNDNAGIDLRAYKNLNASLKDMIQGVFNLSELNARDIMIPRVDIIAVDSTIDLKNLVGVVCKAGHSRVPVFEETIDHVLGILYVKDLLKLITTKSRKKFQLKNFLHGPFFVPETMPLNELLLEFRVRKLHLAIVIDEYGGIGGIVTLEDILEEIVGEIQDEFDVDELPEFETIGKNHYEVDSRIPISEFNEKLGLTLSSSDFDTIGGYVFDLFGKIPEQGEAIKEGNITFTIKEIHGTVINRISVTLNKKK